MTQMIARPWSPVQVLVLVLVGALISALVLAVAVPAIVQAQSNGAIEFPENSKESVATFTADDPEGVTSITWSLAADAAIDGVEAADIVDGADHFTIDEDGVLKFSSPPDYENPSGEGAATNTYKVVVLAADAETGGQTGFHKVTVKVTKVDEPGTVALVTDTSDGTPQYLVGTELTATVTDGDITDPTQTFTADRAGEVTGVVWRWYRGETQITGADATDYTYTLVPDDAGEHIRAVVYYVVAGNVDQEMAEVTTDYPVLAARVGASQLKFDPAAVSRTISEGAKDRNVGAPVTATGNHGTIRYILADSGDATAGAVKFKIDEKTGQISTAVKLDFEADAAAAENCATKNSCTVTVIATDSTGTVTGATAPNLSATVTIKITAADRNVGARVTATGNHGTIRYTLTGTDADAFDIDAKSGQISTAVALNFEAADGADNQCATAHECQVTVTATDSTGVTGITATVNIAITNVDEKPTFTETDGTALSPELITSPENRTALFDANVGPVTTGDGVTYAAMDPEGLNVNLTLMGADAARFSLSDAGVLSFAKAPDREMPTDANKNNVYEVTVRANDGTMTADRSVKVTVSNVDEAPEIALVPATGLTISGRTSVSLAEGGSTAVGTYTVRGMNAASATWTVSGTDAGAFSISSTGALSFRATPDYEIPADANADNVYMVTLTASAAGESDTHDVVVTVTDVDEDTTPPADPLLAEYDPNGDGVIEEADMLRAVSNFFGNSPTLSETDMLRLVVMYFQ
jgi:serralysin